MKAYKVWDASNVEDYETIVFAETARAAKIEAQSTDTCRDARYIDIRVKREPLADVLYKGESEIDWRDEQTRLFLVKELGWACLETSWECDECTAKEFCRHWQKRSWEC